MKLASPGTGEISDRLTILALKILAGQEARRDVSHFETERTLLQQKIHARTLNGMWFDSILELSAVNAMLWHAEDDLRGIRKDLDATSHEPGSSYGALLQDAGEVAIRIQRLNDRRAELVTLINVNAGDGEDKEKL